MSALARKYVVAELHGRLGNQLFQFASAYAVARHRDVPLLFSAPEVPPDDLLLPRLLGDRYREATPRELLRVGHFEYPLKPTRLWRSAIHRAARASRRVRRLTPPSVTYWQRTGRFRPEVFDLDLPVYIQGHLQSERYFLDVAQEIVDSLAWPRDRPQLPASARPAVALSFRRGDYNSLGWALGLDYYERALAKLAEQIPQAAFVLFGDDQAFLELMSDRVARFGSVLNALSEAPDPISQLWMLSQCDHCVIANSSFAWWGAWLGDRFRPSPDRLVIAPSEYGASGDRIPSRWLTIEGGSVPM